MVLLGVVAVGVAGVGAFLFPFLGRGGAGDDTSFGKDATPAQSSSARAGNTPSAPSVPQGYHLVKEDRLGGVSFPVPDGWQRKVKSAEEIQYLDPNGLAGLRIDALDFANSPLQHWQQIEPGVRGEYADYKLVGMEETTFLGQPAAVWEFTFQGQERQNRAIDLGFGRKGGNKHAIYLTAPSTDWARYRAIFDAVRDGFREGS